MMFDKRDRKAKVIWQARQLKGVSPAKTLETMMDMNDAVLRLCIDSIRSRQPHIKEKELLAELEKIYRAGRKHEKILQRD
jgi:hypothetical protein